MTTARICSSARLLMRPRVRVSRTARTKRKWNPHGIDGTCSLCSLSERRPESTDKAR